MPFEDLSPEQSSLLVQLVERLATGNFESEFLALVTHDRGWYLRLVGQGGADDSSIDGFKETDLRELESAGYITLIDRKNGFLTALRPKAYREYKLGEAVDLGSTMKSPSALESNSSAPLGFGDEQLVRIEQDSHSLRQQLQKNYELSRDQAGAWFRWTLIVAISGFVFLFVGVLLAWIEFATVGTVSAVGGVISEFLGLVFFRQAKDANERQDRYHLDLITRQKILDAVQAVRIVSREDDRNRLTESIILHLLGLDAHQNTTES